MDCSRRGLRQISCCLISCSNLCKNGALLFTQEAKNYSILKPYLAYEVLFGSRTPNANLRYRFPNAILFHSYFDGTSAISLFLLDFFVPRLALDLHERRHGIRLEDRASRI